VLILIILFGCEPKDNSDPLSDVPPDPCNDFSEEECNRSSECYPIYGRPITETDYGYCYDPDTIIEIEPEWLICQSTMSSITIETVAGPEDGSACYWFSNGTYPEGWIEDCSTTIGLQCEE